MLYLYIVRSMCERWTPYTAVMKRTLSIPSHIACVKSPFQSTECILFDLHFVSSLFTFVHLVYSNENQMLSFMEIDYCFYFILFLISKFSSCYGSYRSEVCQLGVCVGVSPRNVRVLNSLAQYLSLSSLGCSAIPPSHHECGSVANIQFTRIK